MPLTPNNREEHWLQGMVDGETTLTPNNRREHWYEEIINASGGGGGGTGGGALIVHDNDGTLDKTWQEIADAGFAILNIEGTVGFTCNLEHSDAYYVTFATILPTGTGFDDPFGYATESANGYPVMSD